MSHQDTCHGCQYCMADEIDWDEFDDEEYWAAEQAAGPWSLPDEEENCE